MTEEKNAFAPSNKEKKINLRKIRIIKIGYIIKLLLKRRRNEKKRRSVV